MRSARPRPCGGAGSPSRRATPRRREGSRARRRAASRATRTARRRAAAGPRSSLLGAHGRHRARRHFGRPPRCMRRIQWRRRCPAPRLGPTTSRTGSPIALYVTAVRARFISLNGLVGARSTRAVRRGRRRCHNRAPSRRRRRARLRADEPHERGRDLAQLVEADLVLRADAELREARVHVLRVDRALVGPPVLEHERRRAHRELALCRTRATPPPRAGPRSA